MELRTRKILKIAGIVLGILLLLFVLLSLCISPIAKWAIEKHSEDWIGRQIMMNDLSVNLFTGTMKADGLVMKEKDGKADFIRIDTLRVAVNPFKLILKELNIRHIALTHPQINVIQNADSFNFTDLLESGEEDEEETPWAIGIYDIRLRNGVITYHDMPRDVSWELKNLLIDIPGVYFSGRTTDAGVSFRLAEGGSLTTRTKYDMEKNRYDVNLEMDGLSLKNFLPYLQDYLNVHSIEGNMGGRLHVNGSVDMPTDVTVGGALTIQDLQLCKAEADTLLCTDQIRLAIAKLNPQQGICHFRAIEIDGMQTHYDLYADGDNFTGLIREDVSENEVAVEQDGKDTDAKPLVVQIDSVTSHGSTLTFVDHTLRTPFSYRLTDLSVESHDFSTLSTHNNLRLRARTPGGGTIEADWSGSSETLQEQDLVVFLNNVELKDFTPYTMEYFAYPVIGGRMNLKSQNRVRDYRLDGKQSIEIYNCRVGEKDKALKTEYNVPLKTALYILRDRHDKIGIDLEMKGNVSDPEFSYRKILIKALCNLLVKLSVSPVQSVLKSFGMSGDALSEIAIIPSQPDLNSSEYAKLDQLVGVQQQKPELKLLLTQQLNWQEAVREQTLYALKERYYLSQHPEKDRNRLTMMDRRMIRDIADSDKDLLSYAKKESGIVGDLSVQASHLYPQDSMAILVRRNMQYRNERLRTHLSGKVGESSVIIRDMPVDSMKAYRGGNSYKVDFTAAVE